MIELDEVLLNPASTLDELGLCGSGPEVEELVRKGGGMLLSKFGEGGTGVLLVAKLDVELVPLGQECVNSVVSLQDKTFNRG